MSNRRTNEKAIWDDDLTDCETEQLQYSDGEDTDVEESEEFSPYSPAEDMSIENPESFQTGLLEGVCSSSLCLQATCFDPCLFARTNSLLDRSWYEDPSEVDSRWSSYINFDSVAYGLLSLWSSGLSSMILRTARRIEVRQKYGINGNWFKDLGTVAFMPCCAMAQEHREVVRREQQSYNKTFSNTQKKLEEEYVI